MVQPFCGLSLIVRRCVVAPAPCPSQPRNVGRPHEPETAIVRHNRNGVWPNPNGTCRHHDTSECDVNATLLVNVCSRGFGPANSGIPFQRSCKTSESTLCEARQGSAAKQPKAASVDLRSTNRQQGPWTISRYRKKVPSHPRSAKLRLHCIHFRLVFSTYIHLYSLYSGEAASLAPWATLTSNG
jgi:hypothetical protein